MIAKTTNQIAQMLGVPAWTVRRVVDSLGETIPRAGLYRLIPEELVGRIREELRKKGYLPDEAACGI